MHPTAIEVFARYYRDVEAGARGTIAEASITPLDDLPQLQSFMQRVAERPAVQAAMKAEGLS